jgi:hypothetical protein
MQTFAGLNEHFIRTLISKSRSTDIGPAQDIYARFLGNWKLKMMDPKTLQWHINWFNPVSGIHNQLTARTEGDRIIQETAEMDGSMMRWIFEDITADSFHWYGESTTDKGKTWILDTEFFAERVKNQPHH